MLLKLLNLSLTIPQAQTGASIFVGFMIVATFALAAVIFIRLAIWWWDQK